MQQVTCTHLKEATTPVKTKEDISAMDMCLMIFKENNDFKNAMLEQMKQLIDITIENKQKQSNAISTIGPPIKNKSENELSCMCGKKYMGFTCLLRHKENCSIYKTYLYNNNIRIIVCDVLGCTKFAVDVTGKCKQHRVDKRCNDYGCARGAISGTNLCMRHGGGTRCDKPGCARGAISGTNLCMRHGGGTRCDKPGCARGAVKNASNNVKNYCVAHGGGNRCPNCITWIDSRGGTAKYDGYCATCFKRIFPDDARSKTIYSHTKETMVRNIINNNFKGFIHDKPLYTGNCDCTHRRRIDHRKMFNDTILAVETDEFGHRGYDKHDEEIRYDDLYMIHSGKWIFIRFNPDDNVSKMDIEDKLNVLIETIDKCISRIETGENTELVEIIKLFC
jgi:hypothetical protein